MKKLPPIPEHLKLLGEQHTEPIKRKLRSFENAIWLSFLRGKQAGEEEHKKVILSFLSYVATCKLENQEEWMIGLQEKMNVLLEVLKDEDRMQYRRHYGCFEILKDVEKQS